jgi:4-amino-4-deoxy-L-arabinose transferase-like glycosyltransferase
VILLGGFAIRTAAGLLLPAGREAIDDLPDQREYLVLGENLAEGRGLQFYDPRFNQSVVAFRTPGYPALLALCGANVRAVRLVQALIDTFTVLAIYLLGRRIFGRRDPGGICALIAASLVALNPFLIYFTALILSETLFTALLAWGMLLLVVPSDATLENAGGPSRFSGRRTATACWLCGGLLLALAALVRPSAAALPLVLGIAAAFMNRRAPPARQPRWPLPVGATMLLLTLLVLAPWAYRNDRLLGQWIWTTTNGGITAYDGFNPDATGASDQSFVRMMPQLKAMGEVARSQYLAQKAQNFVKEHPARSFQLAVLKAGRTWSPVPLSDEYGSWKYRAVGLLYSLPLDLLVLAGLFSPGMNRAAKVFLLLPAIYFTAVHMLSVGSLRYRIPVEPPMAIVAGAVFAGRVRQRWQRSA